ncbi:large conductance mechanosensitive channel [Rhodoligotrophos appendicifer]|uniref:large conductance mechanosensitive channel protein MscL n=1 Tax=Rhodoligotrophos appendicifer TaxID=987056 RepID=UPI001185F50E|nr:large conductance mechanosensitive channel protein MscL [Rhodoligotrophos appendicifer]
MAGVIQEFKEFAVKGNVVDMAIGIIIGASFTTIVKSLVDDIFMPIVGLLTGGVDFTDFFITLKGAGEYPTLAAARAAGAVTINLGLFINACIAFLIVAWIMFMVVKAMNRLQRKAEAGTADVPPPRQEVLLEEIRDALVRNSTRP